MAENTEIQKIYKQRTRNTFDFLHFDCKEVENKEVAFSLVTFFEPSVTSQGKVSALCDITKGRLNWKLSEKRIKQNK